MNDPRNQPEGPPPNAPPQEKKATTEPSSKSDRKPRVGDVVLWRDHSSWRPSWIADVLKDGTLRLAILFPNGSWGVRDMVAHDRSAETGGMQIQGTWRWPDEVEPEA